MQKNTFEMEEYRNIQANNMKKIKVFFLTLQEDKDEPEIKHNVIVKQERTTVSKTNSAFNKTTLRAPAQV